MRKAKRVGILILVCIVVFSNIQIGNIVHAMEHGKEKFISTSVTYNEDETQASIQFVMDSVDEEKYEITSITLDKDGSVVYDKETPIEEPSNDAITYEVSENGSYNFTVKYVEKQEQSTEVEEDEIVPEVASQEEQSTNVTVEVDGIRKAEEKSHHCRYYNISITYSGRRCFLRYKQNVLL